ncbi:MAG: hypothetical protein CFE44_12725 [Burkholderiales bacterium PBB4]|nr:MAG: hypothetical protein CFE44_12725 [Burkholderiales bacterium PBB4]
MTTSLVPRSVKVQMIVILMGVVTALMCGFGAYSYVLTRQSFLQQKEEAKSLLERQLATPASNALWNYAEPAMGTLLESALGRSVQELVVYTSEGREFARRSFAASKLGAAESGTLQTFNMDLPPVQDRQVGHIQVTWSDGPLTEALHATLRRAVMEIVLLNVVLVGLFWFSMEHLLFRRVAALQQALDCAATRERANDIVAMPVAVQDEFGALTHSINAITKRLGAEIEAGHVAEEEALSALNNLQNAQEGLVQAEKMASLGRLVAGVAHELNTPIGNIVTVSSTHQEMVDQLALQMTEGALTRSALQSLVSASSEGAILMQRAAARAATLIQNFKQVAVDQTTDQLREFDLARQMQEVLSVIAPEISKTPVKLVVNLAPGIAMHTYPGPLGQVMTNLVVNAVRHGFDSQRPGTVTVSSLLQGEQVKIVVSDTGQGIPPDNLGKIFDPFFTTKLGAGGTGLGLHICHNIVYGPLRGSMALASTVGVGTTFTLQIPRRVVPG